MKKTITVDGKHMAVDEFSKSKNLKVTGDLYLRGTNITALPEGLSVGGSDKCESKKADG